MHQTQPDDVPEVSHRRLPKLRIAVAVALVTRSLSVVLAVATTGFLARAVTKSELGTYWLALSAVSFAVLLAQAGVGQVTVSHISQALSRNSRGEAAVISVTSLVLVAATSAVIGSVIALATPFWSSLMHNPGLAGSAWFIGTASIACAVYVQLVEVLRGHHRLGVAAAFASQPLSGGLIVSALFLATLQVSLMKAGRQTVTIENAYLAYLGAWILGIGCLGTCVALTIRDAQISLFQRSKRVRDIAAYAAPLTVSALTMFVITQLDLWFVGMYGSPESTATYGVASNLVKFVSAINILFGALIPGVVAALVGRGELRMVSELVKGLAGFGFLTAVAIFILLAVFGTHVLGLIVGPGFEAALGPLLVLSLGHLLNAFFGYPQLVLTAAGMTKHILHASIWASVVTLCILPPFTAMWDTYGAAMGAALGVVTYTSIIWWQCGVRVGLWSQVSLRLTYLHLRRGFALSPDKISS